jgi:acetylornithine/succinyldiaminopimelate/putrescine aminotransferase
MRSPADLLRRLIGRADISRARPAENSNFRRTGRTGILYAAGGFHGLTCSALALMSNPFWKDNFGPFLPDTEAAAFGDLEQLAQKLAARRFAAFIVEPVAAESGILVPPRQYSAAGAGAVPQVRHAAGC